MKSPIHGRRTSSSRTVAGLALGTLTATLALAGCGGSEFPAVGSESPRASSTVTGVASADSPLGDTITLSDAAAHEKTAQLGNDGIFSFDVAGLTPPFTLRAHRTDEVGRTTPIYSIASHGGRTDLNELSCAAVTVACGETDDGDTEKHTPKVTHKTVVTFKALITQLRTTVLAPLFDLYDVPANPLGDGADKALRLMLHDVRIAVKSGTLVVTNRLTGTVIFTGSLNDLAHGTFTAANLPPGPATTPPPPGACSQTPVALGSASSFAVLAGSTVTSTGPTSITGDLGVSPGTAVTGFGPGTLIGTAHAGDPAAAQAIADLTTAYDDAAGRTLCPVSVAGNLGGRTLAPGLYRSTSSLEVSSGNLTLDARGDGNAVFIFQMASTLTTTSGRRVILTNGARAANVYWQVGSSATLGTTSAFQGTIMADQAITLATGATLNGRALARIAAVNLDGNAVAKPTP
jgi:hypothetical protein